MPNKVKLLPCEEMVESVKQSLEDVFYDTLNCAFDADLLARAAIEAMTRPTTVVTDEVVEPIPMMLFCPKCGLQHIDAPDERTPEWTNPPHKSHLCHGCGTIWRPADVPTEGVAAIQSRGSKDTIFYNRAALASMPTVVTGEQPQSAFNVLVDLHDALVMTREHNPHTHVISFVDHAAEFDRATKFLRAAQPGDA